MGISIHPINLSIDTLYVLKGNQVIVIDGGANSNLGKFEKGLEQASIIPEEVNLILLTHGHWDHIASAKAIKQLNGAKILIHEDDLSLISETVPPPPPGLTTWGKFGNLLLRLYSPFLNFNPFEVDIALTDDEFSLDAFDIPGKIIHTPGHTKGSISVLMDNGEAFVGDLAMNMFPIRISPGLPIFGDDMEVVKDSWRKLLDMGVKTIYPAHGKPFPVEVMEKAIA